MYAVVGWVIIQVVATIFPLLNLPASVARIVVVLIALGFPLAIALAWVFDITPTGVQRTEPLAEAAPMPATRPQDYGRSFGFFGIGILVALVAFAALSHVRENRNEHTASGIRSIAVLPFVDMSAKGDQAYFSDGIAEELLNRLSQLKDLKVPARTSSFAFRGSAMGISDIASRLDVQSVLEGSVRRDGDSVRVTARLIDAQTQTELWSGEYEKQVSSVFALQDEIATDIVKELSLKIDPNPVRATSQLADVAATPAAVDAYMKGLALFNRRSDRALRQAVQYFERATAADSSFALGYAMLAQAYAVLPAYGSFSSFDASAKGQAAAAHALELNPNLSEAYAALGQMRQNFDWDFESAERSYRRAILFNNGYATAHQWHAEALLLLGRNAEALSEIDNALDLDPASQAALLLKAYLHIINRQFAPASRILDGVLASTPDYQLALVDRASIDLMTGQTGAAMPLLTRISAGDTAVARALLAMAAASANPQVRPQAASALYGIKGRIASSELALWYALAGLNAEALASIKAAYESGADANLPLALLHPAFDAIRSNPDYQKILSELHMTA